MKKSRIVIPHEHGGWAMVSVPFLLGMIAGGATWMHGLLFLAWFFFYLASYPILQSFRRKKERPHLYRWAVIYSVIALLCLMMPLWQEPKLFYFGPVLASLLIVNFIFASRKKERAFTNDAVAVIVFSIGGMAAYLFGSGEWDVTIWYVLLLNFLHFLGTVFFVKSVIRERNNRRWITYTKIFHVVFLAVPVIIGLPWMILGYLYSTMRTFIFSGKMIRPMKVGIIEMIGAVQFLVIAAFVLAA